MLRDNQSRPSYRPWPDVALVLWTCHFLSLYLCISRRSMTSDSLIAVGKSCYSNHLSLSRHWYFLCKPSYTLRKRISLGNRLLSSSRPRSRNFYQILRSAAFHRSICCGIHCARTQYNLSTLVYYHVFLHEPDKQQKGSLPSESQSRNWCRHLPIQVKEIHARLQWLALHST